MFGGFIRVMGPPVNAGASRAEPWSSAVAAKHCNQLYLIASYDDGRAGKHNCE